MATKEEYDRRKLAQKKLRLGWRDVLRSTAGIVLALIAGVGTITSFCTGIYVLLQDTSPEIHMVGQDAAPFALPFSVKNRSVFFDMHDVEFLCSTPHTTIGNITLKNISIRESASKTTVAAGKTAAFRCPITNSSSEIQSTLTPFMKYRTFGIDREFAGLNFTWFSNAQPPRWVEGYPP